MQSGDPSIILRRWYLVALAFAAGAVPMYAISKLAMPKVYESTGLVYVDRGTQIAALSSISSTLGLQSNQSGYVASILQSETMMRRVTSELKLATDKNFAPSGPNEAEKAQATLKRSVTLKTDKNGAISISVRTKNAQLSADIVNHLLNNLGKLFKTKSQQKATYIEKRIKETKDKLKVAEQQLLDFQQSNKIALIDEETKSFIQQIGALESQLITLDVDLQQTRSQLADEGDLEELVKLRVKAKSLSASRSVLAAKLDEAKQKLSGAPQASLDYARITRNLAMQSKTLEMLTEQHQLASLTQHGEDGDYQIIDWGQPRFEPVGPRASVNAFLGGSVAAAIACLFLLSPRRKNNKETSI
jgi:uncharacterized protein involved in exopolysaccharide biosynthesis